ncbi:hypothetical protein [Mycobacteroides abscessus]|uniref:hypothetical protein n=1 Tax=Mycobacteroides abscessus TaxID=36809 RepID=UPI00030A64FD|nr:hypothetical protein [Mycobacteroides abscessus]
MSLTPRRTVRVPDDEWDAGHAKAQGEGDNLTSVIRRLLRGYLGGHRIEYRVTSKTTLDGAPVVVSGLTGSLEEIRKLYPAARWKIEEYDISPPRPVKAP